MSDAAARLAALRAELDQLDQDLVRSAAARQALVAKIGATKAESGHPRFDRSREREVFARAERNAEAVGLPPGVGRDLMQVLVRASHALQAQPAKLAEQPQRILIVGGKGRMGRLFGRLLAARGHDIEVVDKGDALVAAQVHRADVVMVAVPMTAAVATVEALAPLMREDALLVDINSLKVEVCRALGHCRGEALGTHPMFGPTLSSLERQKVVLCRLKGGPRSALFEAELQALGAELVPSSPERHDEIMAIVQVLTHFGTVVMGRALAKSGTALEETLAFTSPIYRLELAMAGRLFTQDPALYREILLGNPRGEAMRATFHQEAKALATMLEEGHREAFDAAFLEVSEYFGAFGPEAMALSDELIESITKRP